MWINSVLSENNTFRTHSTVLLSVLSTNLDFKQEKKIKTLYRECKEKSYKHLKFFSSKSERIIGPSSQAEFPFNSKTQSFRQDRQKVVTIAHVALTKKTVLKKIQHFWPFTSLLELHF